MANKVAGIIEEKTSSDSNGSTLYKFKVGGKFYSVYANALSPDSLEAINALKAGDEIEGEYVQRTSKAGRTYSNLTSIVKVDRLDQPASQPAGQAGDIKNRSVALSYAKDLVAAGKVDLAELFTQADACLAYMTGAQAEDGQGEF